MSIQSTVRVNEATYTFNVDLNKQPWLKGSYLAEGCKVSIPASTRYFDKYVQRIIRTGKLPELKDNSWKLQSISDMLWTLKIKGLANDLLGLAKPKPYVITVDGYKSARVTMKGDEKVKELRKRALYAAYDPNTAYSYFNRGSKAIAIRASCGSYYILNDESKIKDVFKALKNGEYFAFRDR